MTVWTRRAQTSFAVISAFRTSFSLASPATQKTSFPCCWYLTLGEDYIFSLSNLTVVRVVTAFITWQFGLVVTSLGVSVKLLCIELG